MREVEPRQAAVWITAALVVIAVVFHWAFIENYVSRQMLRDWELGFDFDRRLRRGTDLELPDDEARYSPFWAHWWQWTVTVALGVAVLLSTCLA